MDLTNEECTSNLKFFSRLAIINNHVKKIVGTTMEFGMFLLAHANVVAFPPHLWVYQGLTIVNNFNAYMELVCKLWVLNNPMPIAFARALLHALT